HARQQRRDHRPHPAPRDQAGLGTFERTDPRLHLAMIGIVAVARIPDLGAPCGLAEEGGGLIDRIDYRVAHPALRIAGVDRLRREAGFLREYSRWVVAHRPRTSVDSSHSWPFERGSATRCASKRARVGAIVVSGRPVMVLTSRVVAGDRAASAFQQARSKGLQLPRRLG